MQQRKEALEQLCRRFQVVILYAFGSRAREVWEWLAGERSDLPSGPSDVDIGVKSAPGIRLSVHEKVQLALELEDLLGVNRVDLVCLEDADPFLAANIIRGERLYAQDEYLADEYDLYILRRAGDLVPLERERMALILGEHHDDRDDLETGGK
jgi:predicted nucleotidyltransferase